MTVQGNTLAGLRIDPWSYEVGAEKIREYANAVGESSRIYFDRSAAVAAGFRAVAAPPMFAVVYCRWMEPAIMDERLAIDYARMVHGGQEFRWAEPVCAGDTITTSAVVEAEFHKGELRFVVFGSRSMNQLGEEAVAGRWTMIVRSR